MIKAEKKLLTRAEEKAHGLQIQAAAKASEEILEIVIAFLQKHPEIKLPPELDSSIKTDKNLEFNFVKILEIGRSVLSYAESLNYSEAEKLRGNLKIVTLGRESKDEMIVRNQGLVVKLALTHLSQHVPLDDLTQAGNIGLVRAVEKFNPSKFENRFSSYARDWIKQTISRYVDEQHTIKVPEYQRNKISRIKKVQNEILLATGQEPPLAAVAEECEMSEAEVENLLAIKQDAVSLNKTIGEGDSNLEDMIQDKESISPEKSADEAMVKEEIRKALSELSDNEREVIFKRFPLDGGKEATLEEIGNSQGISKEAVRLKIQRLLKKLSLSPALKNLNELEEQ